jgi:hypothetical protein
MNERFEALTREMNERSGAVTREMNERFEAVNKRFASLEQGMAVLRAQGEAHQRLTQQVLDRLDYGERVAKLESQMAMVLEKITA